MAYRARHQNDPNIIIHNVPKHFLLEKLRQPLQNVANCSVRNLKKTKAGTVTANVQNAEGIQRLLSSPVEIHFAGQTCLLNITSAFNEVNVSCDEIAIDVIKFPEKRPIFQYLSRQREDAERLKMLFKEIGEITISDDKISFKKRKHHADEEEVSKGIIQFLDLYTFYQKTIENCTAADSKYFNSLHSKYKGKCYVCWYKDSHSIKITGKKEAVNDVIRDIEQYTRIRHGYACGRSSEPFQTFTYDDIEPAILRFVFRNKCHHSEFKKFMFPYAAADITQEGKQLTININPRHNMASVRPMVHTQAQYVEFIEEFFSKFSSWKHRFESTHVNTNQPVFNNVNQQDVFVKWHMDTSMVDVVGIKEKVKGKKREILQRLNPRGHEKYMSSKSMTHERKTTHFRDNNLNLDVNIQPALMKFVNKNLKIKEDFENGAKRWSVKLMSDKGRLHITSGSLWNKSEKRKCESYINCFFSKFDTVKLKFDKEDLKNGMESAGDLFKPGERTYCQTFESTVIITGFKEDVYSQKEKIQHVIGCKEMEEVVPVDIFIAQQNCKVWESVEDLVPVSIHPIKSENKIVYRGKDQDIKNAKTLIGDFSSRLFEKDLQDLTAGQINFLRYCKESQRSSLTTGVNKLEAVYKDFKKHSVGGSLIFPDESSEIHLICSDSGEWTKAQSLMQENIIEYNIKLKESKSAAWKIALESVKNLPAFIHKGSSMLAVVCHQDDKDEVDGKINELIMKIEDKQRTYKISWKKAKHIIGFCNIPQANNMKWDETKKSFNIMCSEEDIDTVDLCMDDLEDEIQESHKELLGHYLYEYFTGAGKPEVENLETEKSCSIFFSPLNKLVESRCKVQVINGDIVDQHCDAIVNSIGKQMDLSGQVSKALIKRYPFYPTLCATRSKRLAQSNVYLIETGNQLPWKYIFHVITPTNNQLLVKDILFLLKEADKLPITTLALPTIGTGNLGLAPGMVANCMKEAIAEVVNEGTSHLEKITVVVFDSNAFPYLQNLKSTDNFSENGVTVTVLGTNQQEIKEALHRVEQLGLDQIKTVSLDCDSSQTLPKHIKKEIEDLGSLHQIQVNWRGHGSSEKCILEGLKDKVSGVIDKIKKLLAEEVPHCWEPMPNLNIKQFKRFKVARDTEEFQEVQSLFQSSQTGTNSGGPVQISEIERIQNPFLYKQFKQRKDLVAAGTNPKSVITRRLFHGTKSDKIDKICSSGFDRNFAGENGTAYGRGVYFAVKSSYSMSYTDRSSPKKYMFLADVITGNFTTGRHEYKDPPFNPATNIQFDSVVNDINNPSIFVVFRDSSTYPHYVLTLV